MNFDIITIINKKRRGESLSKEELSFAFLGYLKGDLPDYQLSALLMAICIQDMTDQEVFDLTDLFIQSGERLDLSVIPGIKVDKHSTGGVGDKTTLVVAPIVAACGVNMVKMSGRGLGFTGGTIDKLESIPGFRVNLTLEEVIEQVKNIQVVICSQTANLTPLDKKIYALRDVTATTESIPLIAASIMSKKIASGADKILVDIKVGQGALIKNAKDAQRLSDLMIKIGKEYHCEVRTIMTDMNIPLGRYIGNSLEVSEAVAILEGKVKNYLSHVCKVLAAHLVSMGKDISFEMAMLSVEEVIDSKEALNKFLDLVQYQKGELLKIKISQQIVPVVSPKSGTVTSINAQQIGEISRRLGAGRENMEDEIDYSVGIILDRTLGTRVEKGDILCRLFVNENSVYRIEDVIESYRIE